MELNNTDNKTCDACIEYIGEKLVCEKCFLKVILALLKIDIIGHTNAEYVYLKNCKNKQIKLNYS